MAVSKVKIELIPSGIRQLLRSSEMLEVCHDAAKEMATKAGDGFETSPYVGVNRVNASVYAATEEAAARGMDDNTLLRAMGDTARQGKYIEGYYRQLSDGRKVWVNGYYRK